MQSVAVTDTFNMTGDNVSYIWWWSRSENAITVLAKGAGADRVKVALWYGVYFLLVRMGTVNLVRSSPDINSFIREHTLWPARQYVNQV